MTALRIAGIYFGGNDIAVRPMHKRNGSIGYAVYRPDSGAVLDEFGSLEFANKVAEYIEEHGGSYEKENRNAAKAFASRMPA